MRVAFLSREPILHQFGGSTTSALNLLEVMVAQGCQVDLLVSSAYSRSPRLFWRRRIELPLGVGFDAPGFLRLGSWFVNPLSPAAWGRFLVRLSLRLKPLRWLRAPVLGLFRDKIVEEAWDLTPPGPNEIAAALRLLAEHKPDIVVVNYAFWTVLFAAGALRTCRRVVMMHDLLSARVERFREAGLPLDCIPLSLEAELAWLNRAEIVLAVQETEAAAIRPLVQAQVLVQPIVLPLHPASEHADRNRCFFVGTRIQPNQTGIEWFLRDVWPLVLAGNPEAIMVIAGSVCDVVPGGTPRTTLLGTVESLDEPFRAAGVCVIPLLVGSGLKIKLLEALAFGKACVATPIGVQGLEADAPGVLEVAAEPAAFAAAVLRLMRDDALRHAREQAALALVRKKFRPESDAVQRFAARLLQR